jgi:hypothetical protein
MNPEQLIKELEHLAVKSGINLRYDKGDFEGGFCILKSDKLIMINKKLAPSKKASVLARALAEIGVEEMYLKPAVRQFIEDELVRSSK